MNPDVKTTDSAGEKASSRAKLAKTLKQVERLARALDEGVRLPLVGVRVPLDPLIGLVPGLGDAVTAAVSVSIILRAFVHRPPPELIAKMIANVAVDFVVGAVPIAGDVFDFFFRANMRNLELLRRYYDELEARGETPRTDNP